MTIARRLLFGAWTRDCEPFAAILSPTLFSNLGKHYHNEDSKHSLVQCKCPSKDVEVAVFRLRTLVWPEISS